LWRGGDPYRASSTVVEADDVQLEVLERGGREVHLDVVRVGTLHEGVGGIPHGPVGGVALNVTERLSDRQVGARALFARLPGVGALRSDQQCGSDRAHQHDCEH